MRMRYLKSIDDGRVHASADPKGGVLCGGTSEKGYVALLKRKPVDAVLCDQCKAKKGFEGWESEAEPTFPARKESESEAAAKAKE